MMKNIFIYIMLAILMFSNNVFSSDELITLGKDLEEEAVSVALLKTILK